MKVRPAPLLLNAFCPTGEGGGVDPSCSPGGSSVGQPLSLKEQDAVDLWKLSNWGRIKREQKEGGELGAAFTSALSKMPAVQSESYRGITIAKDSSMYDAGKEITFRTSESFSSDKNFAEGWAEEHPSVKGDTATGDKRPVMFIVPKTDSIRDIGGSQNEVVNKPGMTVRVDRVDDSGPVRHIYMSHVHTQNATKKRAVPLSRLDPTRTGVYRRMFSRKLKRQFALLKGAVHAYVLKQDAFGLARQGVVKLADNAFCPTGPGGGVDATCSPGGGSAPEVAHISEVVDKPTGDAEKAAGAYMYDPVAIGVNKALREGKTEYTDPVFWDAVSGGQGNAVAALDKAAAATPVKKDFAAFRGTAMTGAELDSLIAGGELNEKGFMSVSAKDRGAWMYARGRTSQFGADVKPVLFKLSVPAGTGAFQGAFGSDEVVLERGTKWKVEGRSTDKDGRTVVHLTSAKATRNAAAALVPVRSFPAVQLWKQVQAKLDPRDVLALEEEPHVTARYGFLGLSSDARSVAAALKHVGPLELTFGGLSLFENSEQDVLKVDVEGEALRRLNAALTDIPNIETYGDYQPHMTVAYLRPGAGRKYVGPSGLEGLTWRTSRLVYSDDARSQWELAANAFCPTGPGGGVDATCGSHEGALRDAGVSEGSPQWSTWKLAAVKIASRVATMVGELSLVGMKVAGDIFDNYEDFENPLSGAVASGLVESKEFMAQYGVSPNVALKIVSTVVAHGITLGKKLYAHNTADSAADIARSLHSALTDIFAEFGFTVPTVQALEAAVADKLRTHNADVKFATSSEQLAEFERWLSKQLNMTLTGKNQKELWAAYIAEGFRKGAGRAFDDAKKGDAAGVEPGSKEADMLEGGKRQFLRQSLSSPESEDKVKLLASRTFSEMEGVTEQMSTRMGRVLADGLVRGANPREVADALDSEIDIGLARADTVARTEFIRAHAEGQLDSMEELGLTDTGVMVEWSTAGDDRVCEECGSMEGKIFTLADAHGLIPAHPNCRCAFIPAGVGEAPSAAENRAKLTVNWQYSWNVFCPTGPGGGVDASCSPGAGGSSGNGPEQRPEFKAWFHGSKVVDHAGNPKETAPAELRGEEHPVIVYHGTSYGEFDEFRDDKITNPDLLHYGKGFYFTEDVEAARVFAATQHEGTAKPTVMSMYLAIKNPYDIDKGVMDPRDLHEGDRAQLRQAIVSRTFSEEGRSEAIEAGKDFDAGRTKLSYTEMTKQYGVSKTAVRQMLEAKGHDGMTVESPEVSGKGNNRFWIAFKPTQIKRTDAKKFDPNDPKITNVFCPTGPGGGVDPTCSPGGGSGGGIASEQKTPPPPSTRDAPVHDANIATRDADRDGVRDGARVGVPASEVPPPPSIGRLPNLTPHERAVEQAFIEHYENNPDQVAADFREVIRASTKPGEPLTFGTDDAKVLADAWSHPDIATRAENRATLNLALHQTANAIAKRAFIQELDTLQPDDKVLVTVGGCGAGKGFALKNVPEALALKQEAKVVWDSAGDQNATENPWIQKAAESRGLKVSYVYVHAEPETQWAHPERGVVKRAEDPNDGRMVDAKVFADSYALGAKNHQAFYEMNKGNPNAKFVFLENSGKPSLLPGIPKQALQLDRRKLAEFASRTVKEGSAPARVKRGATQGERIWKN